jgi:hypothetical protein
MQLTTECVFISKLAQSVIVTLPSTSSPGASSLAPVGRHPMNCESLRACYAWQTERTEAYPARQQERTVLSTDRS